MKGFAKYIFAQVVDVTALRGYRMPGTLEQCDVVQFLMTILSGESRPTTRRQLKQGRRRKAVVLGEIPKFSERVIATVLNFVGFLISDEGETVLVGNTSDHFDSCHEKHPELRSAKRVSYGWHDEQLTSGEYVATVTCEVSANLDFMAEARRRPRPGVLHPTATDEKDDVGLQGEFCDAEDLDDVQNPDIDELEQEASALRPDIQYKPVLAISSNDLFDTVHRRGHESAGRMSASAKRAREFLEQYDAKYVEMKEPRTCFMTSSSDLSRSASFSVASGLKSQKLLQESRKEKDEQLVDVSDDEMMPDVSIPVDVPVDIAPEMYVTSVSPADMALSLLQQRLPTRQASGLYEISVDQYSACVVAIAPLQKLWIKAGEHQLQHCFGVSHRVHELLALVTPETRLLSVLC